MLAGRRSHVATGFHQALRQRVDAILRRNDTFGSFFLMTTLTSSKMSLEAYAPYAQLPHASGSRRSADNTTTAALLLAVHMVLYSSTLSRETCSRIVCMWCFASAKQCGVPVRVFCCPFIPTWQSAARVKCCSEFNHFTAHLVWREAQRLCHISRCEGQDFWLAFAGDGIEDDVRPDCRKSSSAYSAANAAFSMALLAPATQLQALRLLKLHSHCKVWKEEERLHASNRRPGAH